MIPTKVVLFSAFIFFAVATDVDENSEIQKKEEQNGRGTLELMAGETVIHSRAVKGEDELTFIDPVNYRSKRSGPPNTRKCNKAYRHVDTGGLIGQIAKAVARKCRRAGMR
jgi:hypothetical protein